MQQTHLPEKYTVIQSVQIYCLWKNLALYNCCFVPESFFCNNPQFFQWQNTIHTGNSCWDQPGSQAFCLELLAPSGVVASVHLLDSHCMPVVVEHLPAQCVDTASFLTILFSLFQEQVVVLVSDGCLHEEALLCRISQQIFTGVGVQREGKKWF